MAESKTEWVKLKSEEVEQKVIDLGKKGMSPDKIGLVLRDQHGIPKIKLFGKKIGKILEQAGINYQYHVPVENKVNKLKRHSDKHKHDYSAKRSLIKSNAKLNMLKNNSN